MNWTKKEEDLLMSYAFASDDETINEQIAHARHMMYLEGNHPELTERTFSACLAKYHKLKANPQP